MCNIFKLLLNLGQYSIWNQFLGFSRYFGSLTDVNKYFKFLVDVCGYFRFLIDIVRYFILVKFSGIIRLVESSRFLRCRVNINRNLRLIDLSGFFKIRFRVRVLSYRAFLFAMGGGK